MGGSLLCLSLCGALEFILHFNPENPIESERTVTLQSTYWIKTRMTKFQSMRNVINPLCAILFPMCVCASVGVYVVPPQAELPVANRMKLNILVCLSGSESSLPRLSQFTLLRIRAPCCDLKLCVQLGSMQHAASHPTSPPFV